MLVKTEWHQAGRIILQVFAGDVSLAEMEQGSEAVTKLMQAVDLRLPVHLIVDFSQRKSYAPELLKLPTMRRLFELSRDSHHRLAWLIAIQATPHPVMLFSSTLAARLTGRKFRLVASLEEALHYLHYTDSSLIAHPENLD